MSKQKKKGSVPAVDAAKQALLHQKRFVERIETLCNALVGHGYFEKIPNQILGYMYSIRYPVLKVKADPESNISKSTVVQANKLLALSLEDKYVTLMNGNKVLVNMLLAEGLLLINFLHLIPANYFPHAALLKEAFEGYFPDTEAYEKMQEMINVLSDDVTILLSDLNKVILQADYSETACFDISSKHNDIHLHDFKTDKTSMVINGKKREMIRLGWVDPGLNWVYPKVKPSALGFETKGLDLPLDVYIQTHALKRLQLRIDITPGIMHFIAFNTFMEPVIKYHKDRDRSLVEFEVSNKKAGYLQVELHENRLIVHTFLFLTNSGTPEGTKLEKLVGLQKEDKKYLEIDRLATFNSYHIENNEQLKELFIKAGCGSLLELGHLQEFSENEVKDKDPDSILKYVADSDYFKTED